jgi:hypothetical protein
MIETALGIINTEMNSIGVPYEFMRWTSQVNDRYWVGEYTETPTGTEDGYEEGTLILTGTTKDSWLTLMQDRATIKDHFPTIGGLRKSINGGTVVFFYDNSFPVPTGEADLKRIQVNLHIKMWKGMK